MKHLVPLMASILFSGVSIAGGSHDHGHGSQKFAVGMPAKGEPDRVIEVSMRDTMRFEFKPGLGQLRDGETIEFVVRNDGMIRHEFSIGNAEEQAKHAAMMRKMPDMQHEDPNTVSLSPGETETLKWRFMGRDMVVFACNIPGHFEAGMKHELAIGDVDGGGLASL